MNTAAARLAAVRRAAVAVVATRRRSGDAASAGANIVRCAGVSIAARAGVVHVLATFNRVAGIIRAHIAIVTVGRWSARAMSARANVIGGAGVAVVAWVGIVHMHAAGGWIA